MRGGSEARIATASSTAARENKPVIGCGEIVQLLAGGCIVDDRANRHRQFDRFAYSACAVAPFSVPASLGFMLWIEAEVEKSIVMGARCQNHVAATAAIAAARPAARNELLAPER